MLSICSRIRSAAFCGTLKPSYVLALRPTLNAAAGVNRPSAVQTMLRAPRADDTPDPATELA